MAKSIDITGKKYGFLTAIRFSHYKDYKCGQRHRVWLFRCECGNDVLIPIGQARAGGTKSCGCKKSEFVAKARTSHGYANHRKTGKINSTYLAWVNIRNRCFNKKNDRYHVYGGRGITVCERWMKFENFISDMGEKPEGMSIERIDVNKEYSPENCKWIPMKSQYKNKTNTILVEFNGVSMCLADASKLSGMSYSCLYERLKNGISGEMLFKPSGYFQKT